MGAINYNTKYWSVVVVDIDGSEQVYNLDNFTKTFDLFIKELETVHDSVSFKESARYQPLWIFDQKSGSRWKNSTDLILTVNEPDKYLELALEKLHNKGFTAILIK